jgi:hypothetical protein
VERLTQGMAELVVGDHEWRQIVQRVSELLMLVPNAVPASDAPSGHGLEPIVRDLRRFESNVRSPLPHWQGRRIREEDQRSAKLLRLRREGKTEESEAA